MLSKLREKAKCLIERHGAEVGAVAKIAANALIPGAPLIVSAVESVCDYTADKGHDLTDARMTEMIEALGGDVNQLESLLGHMAGQLDGVLAMMAQSAQFGTPPQALEAMINTALEGQFSDLRAEIRALTPELETVKRQGSEMLRQQALQGDMLSQVQDQLSAALAFNAPLAGEGIVGPQMNVFLGARGRFQSALLNGDVDGAQSALDQMKGLSPNGNTYRVSAMALRAAKLDFTGAEQEARAISGPGASDPRVQRARQSLTRLTQSARSPSTPSNASSVDARYEVGSKIGDRGWELTALLGRGGMGSVWRARNRRGKEGAVKLMSAALSADASFVSRFQSEIDALDRVSHAAVIEILDWGQDRSGAWYFVMPFIEGQSLRSRLGRGHLSPDQAKTLTRALASGLVTCHAQGVIHRDIKPENVMLKADGSPVLIDFGIAHQEGASTGQTQMATGGYAPPEQLAGRAVDGTADLFALGMTLAESLGPQAGEGMWDELINQLTHFRPARRGTAQELLEKLSESPKKYHAGVPGEATEGPLSVDEVAARVLAGARELQLWWPGESDWCQWDIVAEVKAKVESKRRVTPPPMQRMATPPPMPKRPERKAGDVVSSRVKGVEFKMVYCPAGDFWMGTDDGGPDEDADEMPRHRIAITKPFLMGQTQVTQALWQVIMGSNPSNFNGANLPVESVSWFDCVRFCNKLSEAEGLESVYSIGSGDEPSVDINLSKSGYRLPSEAEWEYAAKAGTELVYAGSNSIDDVAWHRGNAPESTRPVGQKTPNNWQLYDCSGNVYEWCNDTSNKSVYKRRSGTTSDPLNYNSVTNPRLRRGGCYRSTDKLLRVAYRSWIAPAKSKTLLGLRLARSLR